ncbi:MAG TPA: NAD(P)/FAD-dependent oxidoreductase [Candidatus Cybelea sp.]|jgi:geranylgeranyl reductase|nr:NAD(P)/FAD-dependent oxidoreductase [Candidatus Cybelea sp.]
MNGAESAELLVIGCGPAGATAAREAARAGVETLVLERDAVVGQRRVCAAGLRPGFCETFDVPRAVVHCDTPRLAFFDAGGTEYAVAFGPGHTSTREELDGTMADLARREGAKIRTQSLFRTIQREGDRFVVEYADFAAGERRRVAARYVFFAQGATARLDGAAFGKLAMARWSAGLLTTLQYRVYLDRPAADVAYQTLELHYFATRAGRQVVAWMFPKRDHLAIGLGVMGKIDAAVLRAELDAFTERVRARLYPESGVARVKTEGHLLYGGAPRPHVAEAGVFVGGTAAGLVDATNGEGIFEAAMSGRFVADVLACAGTNVQRASERYASLVAARLKTRLVHRVRIMEYLERQPRRFTRLFEQLARTPRLAAVLLKEDCERTVSERFYLYQQALRFGLRTLASRG